MGRNKFAGVWFGLGVVCVVAELSTNGVISVAGLLFIVLAYLHECLLSLFQIEQNTRHKIERP